MRTSLLAAALLALAMPMFTVSGADPATDPAIAEPAPIPLWPQAAPGALGDAPVDIPTITPYLLTTTGTGAGAPALLICPGGGYGHLSMNHEGEEYARFFNANGIVCFVLKYRLGTDHYHYPAMFLDVCRALRTIRARATGWGVDPNRVGVIGSSAGGHLASTLLTHFDTGDAANADPIERQGDRPDLGILCYPVITMGAETHGGSRANLLGPSPAPELVKLLSNELQVTAATPPCFLFTTDEDKTVNPDNSLLFAEALHAHGVPFDLHIYQHGGHGMGLGGPWDAPEKLHPWTRDCLYWLKLHGFVQ